MGFESVLVSFQGFSGTPDTLANHLSKFIPTARNPSAKMTSSSLCLLLDDGRHKLEVEVSLDTSAFSLRFALCNPRSIDKVFLKLIKALMQENRLAMRFCEDSDEVPEWFTTPEMIEKWAVPIQRCLECRRQQWQQEFGDEEFPATCAEAFQQMVLPRSQEAAQ